MAILRPDTTTTLNRVKINEYLLTRHNPNRIAMPSVSMEGKGNTAQLPNEQKYDIIEIWKDK